MGTADDNRVFSPQKQRGILGHMGQSPESRDRPVTLTQKKDPSMNTTVPQDPRDLHFSFGHPNPTVLRSRE